VAWQCLHLNMASVCLCQATLCLLLSLLWVESPEQCRVKFRKMPSCSCSESKDSVMMSITMSGLDARLVPGLMSRAKTLEDEGESNSGEQAQ